MKAIIILVGLMSLGVLSGCERFHDHDSDSPPPQPEDPPTEPIPPAAKIDPIGRWDSVNTPTGLVFNDTNSGIEFAYISDTEYTAHEYFITDKTETGISGTVVRYTSNAYKSNLIMPVVYDSTVAQTGTFDAEIVDKTSMKITIVFDNGDLAVKTYTYSSLSQIDTVIDAVWSGVTETRDLLSFSLSAGVLNGSDTAGCIYNGISELKNTNYNNITVTVTVSGCSLAGSYYGVLQSQDTTTAILSIISSETTNIILTTLN